MINASAFSVVGNERRYLLEALDSGRITQGSFVARFEIAFAKLCGTRYAVACNSGTAALHLAMLAAGIGPADAVVVPALTYIATANAATYCGARVFFCDVDPLTWCLDPLSCAAAIRRARAVGFERVAAVPVHLYDATAPVEAIEGADLVIEDAAHAPGASRGGRKAGALGDAAAFSFYGSKVIATGEGGAMVTDDPEIAAQARLYRGQGAATPGRYHHAVVGYNYRMTDLAAALGLAQLEGLPDSLEMRRGIIDGYRAELTPLVTFQCGALGSGWIAAALLPPGADRDDVACHLLAKGIETRPFFEPLPSLPPYYSSEELELCPVAVDVARRGLCLPTHLDLSIADVQTVCAALSEALAEVPA